MGATPTRESIRFVNTEGNGIALFLVRNGETIRTAGSHKTPDGTGWGKGGRTYATEDEASAVVNRLVQVLEAAGLYVAFRN